MNTNSKQAEVRRILREIKDGLIGHQSFRNEAFTAENLKTFNHIEQEIGQDDDPDMRILTAEVLCDKAYFLERQLRSKDSLEVYMDVVRRFRDDQTPGMREFVARAISASPSQCRPAAEIAAEPTPRPLADLERGIYLEDRQSWLPWGSLKELEHYSGVKREKVMRSDGYVLGHTYLIENPTLFGLKVASLYAKPQAERPPTWPVRWYEAAIRLGKPGHEDFDTVVCHMTKIFGEPETIAKGYIVDRRGDLHAIWRYNMTELEVCAFRGDSLPGCDLILRHTPSLSAFYETEHPEAVQLHEGMRYFVFDSNFELYIQLIFGYRPFLRSTPPGVKGLFNEKQAILWIDKRDNFFGIGNAKLCHTIELCHITRLELEFTYFRDRFNGLKIYAHNEKGEFERLSEIHSLDEPGSEKFVAQLKEFITEFECFTTRHYSYT